MPGNPLEIQQSLKKDIVSFQPDSEDIVYDELWVEDSLGIRHSIPKSREHIKKLLA
jgi:hypothetical protein